MRLLSRFPFVSILGISLLISCSKSKVKDPVVAQKSISCLSSSLSAGVIVFYPFSNGSLNDFSGNNCHLTNQTLANSCSDRNNNSNCAYQFHYGTNSIDFLKFVNPTFLNSLDSYSVSLWYEALDTNRSGNIYETLISRDSVLQCPDRIGQWSIGLFDCRKAVFGRFNSVWDNNVISYLDCHLELKARTGSWHHLVATFNKNNNYEMKIYRDGMLQNFKNGIVSCGQNNNPVTVQDIGDLFIGYKFNGKIDDIIIYNYSISQNIVQQLFNLQTCCAD